MNQEIQKFAQDFEAHNKAVLAEIERVGGETKGFKTRMDEFTGRVTEIEQTLAARKVGGGGDYRIETAGASVIGHEQFKSFGGSRRRGKFSVEVKTITTGSTSAGALITPDRRPEIVMLPQQRLTVRDLLTVAQTTSSSVEYPRQTVRTNNAAVVTEGDAKPQSSISFELKTVPVRTIAHYVKASKQALDDAPMLQATIDSELRYGLKLVEEEELLNGDGTGQHLLGVVPQATAFASPITVPDRPNRFDVLLMAIAQSELALLPATGIVLNDLDLTAMRTIKNADGDYIVSGGPFSGPITSIWGRSVVGTPSMDEGDFLIGAFKDGATLYDRWDAQVLVSTENEDDFIKNLCAVLGEERLALAVRRPQAFISGDFGIYT
jgi:HK97 family phage major capsid protein